jgi:voltage-gated sodium channel
MGLDTSVYMREHYGALLDITDEAILAIFVLEIVALLLARGFGFFKDGWAVFDFIVIAIALVPASGPFAVLRALRVLRVLRLATKVPSLHKVISGLLAAIPGLGSVGAVMGLIFYVSGVLATNLFSKDFPDTFGTLGLSLYTLFQVMTGDGWSDSVARPIMEVFPYAWIFFVIFILISTFVILNLFIAVIVDASNDEEEGKARAERDGLRDRLDQLLIEVKDIKQKLKD